MRELTIVVPHRNAPEALDRLLRTLPIDVSVIVVDDVSEAPPNIDPHDKQIKLIRRHLRGYFSGAVNVGISACNTDVLLLNQDMVLKDRSWWDEVDRLRRDYAVFGDGIMTHPAWPQGYVQGTVMFMRRDAIAAVGGFNERDFPLWGATAEWQARVCRKGFRAMPMSVAKWWDHEERHDSRFGTSITKALETEPEKRDLFLRTPPLVSVVIPCYNYGRYLHDAIGSLVGGATSMGPQPGQTWGAWEAIIVDDASTDDSAEIGRSLADLWKGVHFVRLARNVGTAEAINAGVRQARGRFYSVLSADDMYAPTYLETFYRVLESDPGALVYCDAQLFAEGHRMGIWEMKEYDFPQLLERNHVPAMHMASVEAWKEVGGYPPLFKDGREDWAFAVAMGKYGHCGIRIPEALWWYRREDQNRSKRNTNAVNMARFKAQIRAVFPDLFQGGVLPVGCCGGARRPARSARTAPSAVSALLRTGETGMTLIEYIGKNTGRETYWGPVTGTRYGFGLSHKYSYVDDRDLDAMLNLIDGRRPVFRLVPRIEPPAEVAEETQLDSVSVAPEAQIVVEPEAQAFADAAVEQARDAEVVEPVQPMRRRRGKNAKST